MNAAPAAPVDFAASDEKDDLSFLIILLLKNITGSCSMLYKESGLHEPVCIISCMFLYSKSAG